MREVRDAATAPRQAFGTCRTVGMGEASKSSKVGTSGGHGTSKDVDGPAMVGSTGTGATLISGWVTVSLSGASRGLSGASRFLP